MMTANIYQMLSTNTRHLVSNTNLSCHLAIHYFICSNAPINVGQLVDGNYMGG